MSTPTDDALPVGPCLDEYGRENHPAHASLSSLWCRACGVFKIDGVYQANKGTASLIETLQKIEKVGKS